MAGDMGVNSLGDWEFPGDLAIRIPGFHCCGQGSILGWGTEILQAMQQGKKKKRKSSCYYNSEFCLLN